ncbi:MAG: DUF502 domain-containing protein [bacterium]
MFSQLSRKIRTWFIYGVIIVLPVAVTVWLVLALINVLSVPLNLLLGERLPSILYFLITLVIITIIGLFGRNIIGRTLFKPIEALVNRIPLINVIYKSSKQIISSFAMQDNAQLKPVLIEYPRKGLWAIGFLTQTAVAGIITKSGADFGSDKVAVLIPTTPNPTSGFFVYVPKTDIQELDISIEDSVRVLMSAGVVNPAKLKTKEIK